MCHFGETFTPLFALSDSAFKRRPFFRVVVVMLKSKKIFGTDCWVLKSPPMFNADVETLDQCDQMAEFFHIFPSLAIKNYPIANKLPN